MTNITINFPALATIPTPTAITISPNPDGTNDILLSWSFKQNVSSPASGFLLYYGPSPLTTSSPSMMKSVTSVSHLTQGVSQAWAGSIGIASYQNTPYGQIISEIQSISSWNLTGSTPNITATINGITAADVTDSAAMAYAVKNWLNAALSDGTISVLELQTTRGVWDKMIAEQASINAQATKYGLTIKNTAYNNALIAVGTFLNGGVAWTTGIPSFITTTYISTVTNAGLSIGATTGATLRSTVSAFETARTTVFQGISDAAAGKGDAAQATADKAIANAADASIQATAVNDWANNVLSDGNVSVSDLKGLRWGWNVTATEKADVIAQAGEYGLTAQSAAYSNAIQALGNALNHGHGTWVSPAIPYFVSDAYIGSASIATVGLAIDATTATTLKNLITTYETARSALLRAVADEAATRATYTNIRSVPTNIATAGNSPTTPILNTAIAVTPSGTISGIGTGNGTVVDNSKVTPASIGAATTGDLATKLTNGAATVLAGGTVLKTSNYDTEITGSGGLALSNNGITAHKRNAANTGWDTTFAVTTDGTATFSGEITGSNGVFTAPKLNALINTYPVSVIGALGDVGVFGSGTFVGVYGQSVNAGSTAIRADNNNTGGASIRAKGRVEIESDGLQVVGGIRILDGNVITFPVGASVCTNLSANYLQGNEALDFIYKGGVGTTARGINKISLGWATDASGVKLQVDTTDMGYVYTSAGGHRVPYNELTGTVPVWNQNTTGTATNALNLISNVDGTSWNIGAIANWVQSAYLGISAKAASATTADNASAIGGFAASRVPVWFWADNGGASPIDQAFNIVGDNGQTMNNLYVKTGGYGGATYGGIYISVKGASASDKRVKKDIEDISLGLDFINALRPVSYRLISDDTRMQGFGFIAQEIQQVLQDDTTVLSHFDPEREHGDIKGINVVNYESFIAPLTKAIQELSAKVTELETKLTLLENK